MAGTSVLRPPFIVTENLKRRLYGRCEQTPSGCWLWRGSINPTGYGKIKIAGKAVDTHVASWRVAHGGKPVPLGMLVMHLCDVRNCINPQHLQIGSSRENMRHAAEVGALKPRRGADVHNAVLDEETVLQILTLRRETGHGSRTLSKLLGLSHGCVDAVIRGRTWRHLTE